MSLSTPLPHLLAPRFRCAAPPAGSKDAKKEQQHLQPQPDLEDDDVFVLPCSPRRQLTDSVLQTTNLRRELECTIAELLKSQLSAAAAASRETEPEMEPKAESHLEERLCQADAADESGAAAEKPQGSGDVPSEAATAEPQRPPLNGCTTLMIRHVPPKLTQRQLMREVNDLGFSGRFDFLYIPMDSRRRANRGIAFVNFSNGEVAQDFARLVDGQPLKHPSSQRPVEIMPADLQGFDRNVAHHIDTLRSHTEMNKPLVLRRLPAHLLKDDAGAQQAKAPEPRPRSANAAPSRPTRSMPSPVAATGKTVANGAATDPNVTAPWSDAGHASPAGNVNFCAFCGTRKRSDYVFCPCCGFRFAEVY